MNGFDGNSRPMVDGNWDCSQCGIKINKLPFAPREDKLDTLKCLDCYRAGGAKQRSGSSHSSGEKQMFEGSWTCTDCGKEITKMPFNPAPGSQIRCIDCYKASK